MQGLELQLQFDYILSYWG